MRKLKLDSVNNFSTIPVLGSSRVGFKSKFFELQSHESPSHPLPPLLTFLLLDSSTLRVDSVQRRLQEFLPSQHLPLQFDLAAPLIKKSPRIWAGHVKYFAQQTKQKWCGATYEPMVEKVFQLLELWDEKPRLASLGTRDYMERWVSLTTKTNQGL